MQTEQVTVTGMTCGGCVTKVTRALNAITGVASVTISLSSGKATVQYDERVTSAGQLKSAVTSAGYGVNGANATPKDQSKGGCCR
jgi:copper chaperone CopZ